MASTYSCVAACIILGAVGGIELKSGADVVASGPRSVGDLVVGMGTVANDKDSLVRNAVNKALRESQ